MKRKSLNVKKKTPRNIVQHLSDKNIYKVYNEFKKSLNSQSSYAVALSGGPDSIALAYLAKCFSKLNNTKILYFIVDHGLREESKIEAKKVLLFLKKFKIECKILVWKGKKPKSNIQSIARNKRYNLLIDECKKNNINNLLIGHHIGDLYENFIIRLLRGSGLRGLTSLDKAVKDKKSSIHILRPLINIKKSELINISKKVFNFYVEDPSNLNEDYKRIRVRKMIKNLEFEGLDFKKLQLTINNLKASNKTINYYVENNIKNNFKFFKSKNIYSLNDDFFNQPYEIIFRSFSGLLSDISKRYYPPRGKSVDEIIKKIRSKNFKKATLGGCLIEKINKTVLISRENL